MADGVDNTWYVSFETSRTGKLLGRSGARTTVTFQNEFDAKEFARAKFAEGLNVNAGTINPHFPKRTIASTQIHEWLEQTLE
jgi:hypothetical protein